MFRSLLCFSAVACRKKTNGFSLLEIMLGLFLGSLLLSILLQHYVFSKQQSEKTPIALEQLYDISLVSELIRHSVKQAGFTPCLPIHRLIKSKNNVDLFIQDFPVTWNGPDKLLQIVHMHESFGTVQETPLSKTMVVHADERFERGEQILIADCFHAELNTIQHVQHQRNQWIITLDHPLTFHYIPPVFIGEWVVEQFFIKKNHQNQYALYYRSAHHSELLSHQIQGMVSQLIGGKLLHLELLGKNHQQWPVEVAIRAV